MSELDGLECYRLIRKICGAGIPLRTRYEQPAAAASQQQQRR